MNGKKGHGPLLFSDTEDMNKQLLRRKRHIESELDHDEVLKRQRIESHTAALASEVKSLRRVSNKLLLLSKLGRKRGVGDHLLLSSGVITLGNSGLTNVRISLKGFCRFAKVSVTFRFLLKLQILNQDKGSIGN